MEYSKQFVAIVIVLEQYNWLGSWVEREKRHNANLTSVEEVVVKVEAELGNLNNFGLVNV